MNKSITTFVFSFFFIASILSQDSKKTVILYNVVPLSVELVSDGTIKTIYGRADHYFAGYQLVKTENYFSDASETVKEEEYKDVIVSTNIKYLKFDDQVATLNKTTLAELDRIKHVLFTNPQKKIMLTSYNINNANKRESILLKNRLASCLSYLDIMGVSKDRIVIDSKTQEINSNIIHASEIVNSELVDQE
jgi:hypothetical protein